MATPIRLLKPSESTLRPIESRPYPVDKCPRENRWTVQYSNVLP